MREEQELYKRKEDWKERKCESKGRDKRKGGDFKGNGKKRKKEKRDRRSNNVIKHLTSASVKWKKSSREKRKKGKIEEEIMLSGS